MITLPSERDLPPGRQEHLRSDLLHTIRQPTYRPTWRLVAAGAFVALTILLLLRPEPPRPDRDHPADTLAVLPAAMTPPLRDAADVCLSWNGKPGTPGLPVTKADIAVAARHDDRAMVLFLTEHGYVQCDVTFAGETSGGYRSSKWTSRTWLPGPVEPLALSATAHDSGAVTIAGRVSPRVRRLILEHGNGHHTAARLNDGAFGLLTTTPDVRSSAELVGYDAGGREIYRLAVFAGWRRTGCYTDPTGKVIYGERGPDCRPAERWTR